ncbi:MAG: N-acetylneuraminate synthase family protein [Bacteroidota bacterium]
MVHAAAEAGADYAKIQSMLADDLPRRERFEEGVVDGAGTQQAIKRPYEPEFKRLKPMDLTDDDHHWFIEECQKAGIKPMTTVFSRSRVPFVATLGMEAVKVASYDCASLPLLEELAANFDHLYISTGATYDEEIEATANFLKARNQSFSLLHCVTIYPTPLDEMHLARIDYLRQYAPKVGFSDHSLVSRDGIKASAVAIMRGADVVERHFTVLGPDESRDGPVSLNPAELAELVRVARMEQAEKEAWVAEHVGSFDEMIGEKTRPLSHTELLNRDYYRGRFASRVNGDWVYNWEDKPVAA